MDRRFIGGAALALVLALAGCAPRAAAGVEFGPGTFAAWDADRNNCINETEFGVGWDDEFGAWDTDDSGFIENDEWGIGVGTNAAEFGAFDTWDLNDDSLLSDDEFGTGSFGVFDDNDDDCIGVDEWNAGVGLWD